MIRLRQCDDATIYTAGGQRCQALISGTTQRASYGQDVYGQTSIKATVQQTLDALIMSGS